MPFHAPAVGEHFHSPPDYMQCGIEFHCKRRTIHKRRQFTGVVHGAVKYRSEACRLRATSASEYRNPCWYSELAEHRYQLKFRGAHDLQHLSRVRRTR